MNFDDYQLAASRTMRKLSRHDSLANGGLGLAGEAGEVADDIKKHLFQGHDLDLDALAKELGDVLWYAAATATTLGLSLADIAAGNVAKLEARFPDGFEVRRSRVRLVEEDGLIGGICHGSQTATAQDAVGWYNGTTVDDLPERECPQTYGTDTL